MNSTIRRRNLMRLAEWVLDDLRLETDKVVIPFCCIENAKQYREVALAAMYIRTLEEADRLGLIPVGKTSQVRLWLRTGVLPQCASVVTTQNLVTSE